MKTVSSLILSLAFILSQQNGNAQTGNLFGKIKDASNNEEIIGAKVTLSKGQIFYSDFEGNINLQNLQVGKYIIKIESLGYSDNITKEIEIKEGDNLLLDFFLRETNFEEKIANIEFTASSK